VPPLPHHRAYGSVPRRFDWVKRGAPPIRQATACNCLGNCHRPPPARALIEGVGFAADSPLEEDGFEPSVPRQKGVCKSAISSFLAIATMAIRRVRPCNVPTRSRNHSASALPGW
jgi:hypothetical protein